MNFWHTANMAFSAKERKAFNKWKLDLYLAADRVRDLVPLSEPSRQAKNVKELMDIVCQIPALMK